MVEKQECVVHEGEPDERYLLEAQVGIPHKRRNLGHTYGSVGRNWRRLDTEMENAFS